MSHNLPRLRRVFLLVLIIMVIGLSVNIHFVKAEPTTVYVDAANTQGPWDGSPEYPFENITSGLAHASAGETVYVCNGTYYEQFVIDKPVFLIGENESSTIIDGSEQGTIIKVAANNVTITGFTIENAGLWNYVLSGIDIENVNNTNISCNRVEVSYNGILLADSCNDTLTDNEISETIDAFSVTNSNNTIFSGNTLSDNQFAMVLNNANDNTIFLNNFMNNANFINSTNSVNLWDNGLEGNYWSNYTGKDQGDGIGSSPYFINAVNQDNYPLMGIFTDFAIAYENETQHIAIISNSTVSAFDFNSTFRTLSFNTTTNGGAAGFSRITIPQVLSAAPYIVLINNEQVNATLLPASNSTNAYLYLAYNNTAQEVQVISQPIYDLLTDYNALIESFNNVNSEYNQLLATYGVLNETYSQELENYTQLQANFTKLNLTYEELEAGFLQSQNNYTQVENTLNSMNSTYNALLEQWNLLNSTYNRLASENDSIHTILWIISAVAVALLIITPLMTISYRRRFKDQKQLIEKYRTELERISLQNNARELFEADVKRRRTKIDEFQSKYGVEVRPRGTLEDVIKSLELKKKTGPDS